MYNKTIDRNIEEDKDKKLNIFLRDMALNEQNLDVKEALKTLKDIYKGDYRHMYSECFNVISSLNQDNPDTMEILNSRMKGIYEKVRDSEKDVHFYKCIRKLYDHINLDATRLTYFNSFRYKIEEDNKNLSEHQEDISDKQEKIDKEVKGYRFDVMGITTLILTAFTIISVNATVFAGIVEHNIGLDKVSLMFGLLNTMLICSVFSIYSIIRKIHGDIESKDLIKIIIATIGVLLSLSIIGYLVFSG